jgi:alcohol dehydrogenase YqhD (iron-dependent ADH family)
MENFSYYNPVKMLFGKGQIEYLASEILPYGKRVLLVYGQHHLKATGLYDKITRMLTKAGITWVDLEGVHPNPRYQLVEDGITICRNENIEFVLGIGGGSVSDTAKAVAIGTRMNFDLWDAYEDFNYAMHDPSRIAKHSVGDVLPFGIVMTKAGTGSEFDYTSVLSRRETREKIMIIDKRIYAKFCIDDPDLYNTPRISDSLTR